jgi:hypothetical protein
MLKLLDDYRPELHYMRGPGPKWLEKNAGLSGPSDAISRDHGRNTPTLSRSIELRLRQWLPTRWRLNRAARREPQWTPTDALGGWSV